MKVKLSNLPITSNFISCIRAFRFIGATGNDKLMSLKDAKDLADGIRNRGETYIDLETRMTVEEIRSYLIDESRHFYGSNMNQIIADAVDKPKPEKVGKDTTGNQIFNVPNTPEGWAFMEQLRNYLNPRMKIRKKGRGKNRPKDTWGRDVKPKDGEWVAVYVDLKDSVRHENAERRRQSYEEAQEFQRKRLRREIAQEMIQGGGIPELQAIIDERVDYEVRKRLMEEAQKDAEAINEINTIVEQMKHRFSR